MCEYSRHGDESSIPIETIDDPPADQLAFTRFGGQRRFNEDGTIHSANYWEGREYSYEEVPKEEFYLSFYGLPEPYFGSNWSWSWYFVAGITCIAVGVLIKWRLTER